MFRAHVLIVRMSKLYYTASGINTTISGRPVHGCQYLTLYSVDGRINGEWSYEGIWKETALV